MATRKSGPVKPPTLDLEARKTPVRKTASRSAKRPGASAKPATAASAKPASVKPAPDRRTPASTSSKPKGSDPDTRSATASSAPKGFSPALSPTLFIGIGIIGGGVLGAVLTIALLATGIVQPLIPTPPSPQLELLENRVGINQEQITESLVGFKALDDRVSTLFQTVDQQVGQLQDQLQTGLEELRSAGTAVADRQSAMETGIEDRISAVEEAQNQSLISSLAPLPAFDPAQLQAEIAALSSRIDAMAAGASSGDAQKFAQDLASTQTQLIEIGTSLADLDQRSTALGEQLAGLNDLSDANRQLADEALSRAASIADELGGLRASLTSAASQPAQIAPDAVQLPLALMGLENALDSGRAFATELQSLSSLLPQLKASPSLMVMADAGLLRPDEIVVRFNRLLPEILAARPGNPDAGWGENIWARIASLLALRPAAEVDGNSPDALISRAEAAVQRRDFIGATEAINQLPLAMRIPLGELAAQFQAMREAQILLNEARNLALTPSVTTSDGAAQ